MEDRGGSFCAGGVVEGFGGALALKTAAEGGSLYARPRPGRLALRQTAAEGGSLYVSVAACFGVGRMGRFSREEPRPGRLALLLPDRSTCG